MMFAPRNAEERSERSDEKRLIHRALDAFRHDAFGNFLSQLSDVETPLVSSPAAVASLLGRIREFREQKVECDVPEDIVERAIAFFALECCETLHRIVLRTLITTLHGLSPHLTFYRSSLDHPFRFLLSQGPIAWMAMNPVSIQRRVFAEHRIASLTASPSPGASASPPRASSLRHTSQRRPLPPAPAFSTSLIFSYVRTIRFEQRSIIRERVHDIERSQEELMTRVGHLHQNHHELSRIASLDKLTLSQSVSSAHHAHAGAGAGVVGGGGGAVGVGASAPSSAPPTEMSLYARGIVQQPTPASASSRTSEVAVDVLSPYVNYLKSVLLPKEPDTELRTVDQMLHVLEDIALEIPLYHQTLRRLCATFRRPSHFRRYWPEYTVGLLCGAFLGHWVFTNWTFLEAFAVRAQGAVRNFFVSHVYGPLKAIYEHVFKTITARPVVVKKESLHDSKETLSRMLEAFAVADIEGRSHSLSPNAKRAQLKDVRDRAYTGDMSLVMPKYEADIQSPIRTLIQGDLLQNLLIQIQKEKTDLEVAMAQLNQILEINELTFRFMAAIPALLVCYPAFSFLSGALLGFGSRSRARKHTVSREVARLLRDIDSLLIRNSVSSGLRLIEQPTPSSAALAPTASTLAPAAVPSSAALSALSRAHTLPQTPRMTRTAAADAKQSKTPVPPSRVASRTTGSGSGGHAPSRAPSPAPHRAGLLGVFPHRPSLGFKDNGGLLLGCYRLRLRAADLLRARAVSGVSFAALVEDIGLLEGCDFDVMQKRMIVARLSNQWPGANAAAR